MAPKLGSRVWVLALASLVLLAGCGTWWQQQQAWQQRQALERCLKRRSLMQQQLQQLKTSQDALAALAKERYAATPAPKPIDPELASRFSQLDRQLDEERYTAAVRAWKQREQQRQARWSNTQQERKQRLQTQQTQQLDALVRLDSALVRDGQPNQARIGALNSCP